MVLKIKTSVIIDLGYVGRIYGVGKWAECYRIRTLCIYTSPVTYPPVFLDHNFSTNKVGRPADRVAGKRSTTRMRLKHEPTPVGGIGFRITSIYLFDAIKSHHIYGGGATGNYSFILISSDGGPACYILKSRDYRFRT